jgi:hypothetical protein
MKSLAPRSRISFTTVEASHAVQQEPTNTTPLLLSSTRNTEAPFITEKIKVLASMKNHLSISNLAQQPPRGSTLDVPPRASLGLDKGLHPCKKPGKIMALEISRRKTRAHHRLPTAKRYEPRTAQNHSNTTLTRSTKACRTKLNMSG